MADDDAIVPIPHWKEKLRFLRDDSKARDVGRHKGTRHSFGAAIGINPSTVRDWLDPNLTQSCPITSTVNKTIANRFEFPVISWAPWFLRSFDVFKEEYLKVAQQVLSQRGGSSLPSGIPAPLKAEDGRRERCAIRGLAGIDLTCGQTGPETTEIGVMISCDISPVEGSPYPITVHTAQLEIDCGNARADETSVKGFGKPGFSVDGNEGEVRVRWNAGDMQRLAWLLDATSASLGTVIFEPGLARIERMAPGTVITGSLGTWLKNIEGDESSPRTADEITIVDRLGNPIELKGADLNTLQRRIIEHLIKKGGLEVDATNFAVLARHELLFVKGP